MAEEELQRVSHITRQTLSFYRESKHPIAIFVSEVLDDVLELQHEDSTPTESPFAESTRKRRQ